MGCLVEPEIRIISKRKQRKSQSKKLTEERKKGKRKTGKTMGGGGIKKTEIETFREIKNRI